MPNLEVPCVVEGRSWTKLPGREYYEYEGKAAGGWRRIAVVEHGQKFWWWAVYDGNFFPFKIGTSPTKKDSFNEVGMYLLVLEVNEYMKERKL